MNSIPSGASPLTRDELFRMFAEEACRDGKIEEFELKILLNVARFLRLESETAQNILGNARDKFKLGLLGEKRPLEPRALYLRALEAVLADGQVDPIEDQMLAGLRKMFCISIEEHASLMLDMVPSAPFVEAAEAAAEKAAVIRHQPGATTSHLAQRLEFDAQKNWFHDHCRWFQVEQQASEEAREAWNRFQIGLINQNENEVYDALDAIDDIVASLDSISFADVLLALNAIRWSRCLLKTRFSADHSASARAWPAIRIYERLSIKMGPILISIDHLRIRQGLDEWISPIFVYLLEDLCMLIERRHAEPILPLAGLLHSVFRTAVKCGITHRAADLIAPLSACAYRQGGEVLEYFIELCRFLCDIQPQHHPMVIAADRAIRAIAPEKSVFPADYKPPPNRPSANPVDEASLQQLERLIRDFDQKQESERLLIAALGQADVSAADALKAEIIKSSEDKGVDPQLFLQKYLAISIFPDLSDYPRPVIAVFALGDSSGHQEEMKGGWNRILLKKAELNRLQATPDFPIFPTTTLISFPLSEEEAERLQESLHQSGGAYDVALVDPQRKSARIWHQVGDLDPTGNLHRVERELLPEKKEAEALHCLEEALAKQPWLSGALLHQGLSAKRSGDLEQAEKFFQKALQMQPHDANALARLGVLYKNKNDMKASEKFLLDALKILPVQPSAMMTLAASSIDRLATGDSSALPLWDYYIGGLHAHRGDSDDFREIAAVGDALDRKLARYSQIVPIDCVFYL